jgi:hypothetical protein
MVRRLLMITALAAAVAAGTAACGSSGGSGASRGSSSSAVDPATPPRTSGSPNYAVNYKPGDFSPNVDNPLFPLKPGTTLIYRGTKDEQKALEYFTATRETQKVDGTPCRVVLDRLYLDGKLAETTRDYYSQDTKGNVWYFGEDTAELDEGGNLVSTDGTWHAGEAGAEPGIFMPAHPRAGERHRQEYYPGHAEDFFQVLDLSTPVSVPYRSFSGTLLTREWTPLEPDVLDQKYYVQGIGTVKEMSVKGPLEQLMLVGVKTGG